MGRTPCCPEEGLNRGAWTALEDKILVDYITAHGEGKWRNIPRESGLKRSGKSCRLRWLNYLRPDIKRGNISPEEEDLIVRLHKLLGNRWSLIAGRLPGRTDNEVKNYWNTVVRRKLKGQENSKDDPSPAMKSHITRNLLVKTPRVADSDVVRVKPARVGTVSTIPDSEMHKGNNYKTGCKVGLEPSTDGEQSDEGTKSGGQSPVMTGSEEDNELENLTMDFGISEILASDFSESELWKLCQFESEGMDQQPLLFSEELLKNWTDEGCFQFQA